MSDDDYDYTDDAIIDDDLTAFYWPCKSGKIDEVRRQLENGADINEPDTFFGISPLTWACEEGNLDVVQLLIEKGAKITQNCLHHAGYYGHFDIVKLLLDLDNIVANEGDVLYEPCYHGYTKIVQLLLEKGAIKENNCLEKASSNGYIDVVKLLLAHYTHDESEINDALGEASQHGHQEITQLLLYSGGHPDAIKERINYDNYWKHGFDNIEEDWSKFGNY